MAVVAELMIAANSAVAERIYAAFPGAALLRRHPPPRPEAFAEVRPAQGLPTGSTVYGFFRHATCCRTSTEAAEKDVTHSVFNTTHTSSGCTPLPA